MAEVVLHIGTAKTGTTYVQQRWAHSVPVLAGAGWSYPSFLEASNHMKIASAFVSNTSGRQSASDEIARQFDARVTPQSRWLVTSEGFSIRLRSNEELVALQSFFRQWFDRVRIIVYFRRHDYFALSLYSEAVRNPGGTTRDIDVEYLTQRAARFGLLGMSEMLRRWQRVFGEGNVVARPYLESFKAAPDRLVNEMHQLIGIELDARSLKKPKNTNRSLSQEAALVVRRIGPARDVVLTDLDRSWADPEIQLVANAYRPFRRSPSALTLETSMRFNNALSELTAGPGVALGPEAGDFLTSLIESDGRELVELIGPSPEWNEWLAEPPAPRRTGTGSIDTGSISEERLTELLETLSKYRHLSRRLQRMARVSRSNGP